MNVTLRSEVQYMRKKGNVKKVKKDTAASIKAMTEVERHDD
jgi:hypothetical protein